MGISKKIHAWNYEESHPKWWNNSFAFWFLILGPKLENVGLFEKRICQTGSRKSCRIIAGKKCRVRLQIGNWFIAARSSFFLWLCLFDLCISHDRVFQLSCHETGVMTIGNLFWNECRKSGSNVQQSLAKEAENWRTWKSKHPLFNHSIVFVWLVGIKEGTCAFLDISLLILLLWKTNLYYK